MQKSRVCLCRVWVERAEEIPISWLADGSEEEYQSLNEDKISHGECEGSYDGDRPRFTDPAQPYPLAMMITSSIRILLNYLTDPRNDVFLIFVFPISNWT